MAEIEIPLVEIPLDVARRALLRAKVSDAIATVKGNQ